VEEIAYGELELTEDQFLNATPYWFRRKIDGYRRKQAQQDRAEWERARWIAAALLQPHSKKAIKPTDLLEFADEAERRKKETFSIARKMADDKRFPATLPKKIDNEQSNQSTGLHSA
jgi:hypothetical protein